MAVVPVVQSDGMSAVVRNRPVLVCDVCGFDWINRADKLPDRCASQKCRSIFWNRGKKAVAEWKARKNNPGRPKGKDSKQRKPKRRR
jgi:hypothetical protein